MRIINITHLWCTYKTTHKLYYLWLSTCVPCVYITRERAEPCAGDIAVWSQLSLVFAPRHCLNRTGFPLEVRRSSYISRNLDSPPLSLSPFLLSLLLRFSPFLCLLLFEGIVRRAYMLWRPVAAARFKRFVCRPSIIILLLYICTRYKVYVYVHGVCI